MKKAYLELVLVEPKAKKAYDDGMEDCDSDLTRALAKGIRPKKPTVQRKCVEKDFTWAVSPVKGIRCSEIRNHQQCHGRS